MSIQPQVDVDIINELLSGKGRKTSNPFKLARLDKAVSAFETVNPIEGMSARANYLYYLNHNKEALDYINKAIKRYGYIDILIRTQIFICKGLGSFQIYKKHVEKYLLSINKKEVIKDILTEYINDSMTYMNDTGDFYKVLNKFEVPKVPIREFFKRRQLLSEYEVTHQTIERFLDASLEQLHLQYQSTYEVNFRFLKQIQLIFINKQWSDEEAIKLTENINNAILSIEDVDFQIEADEIEVFCINFDAEKLPEDFSFYEDEEDCELIKVVESRMNEGPNFEVLNV